jgi:rSAM/selenodomain-associated transferase 1
MTVALIVLAKAPVPGKVKTRLCPPCTPDQAAGIAAAALADTLETASAVPTATRFLVLDGEYPAPPGWQIVQQHGDGLGERLANGFADTRQPGRPALLVGMDTPQLTVTLLESAIAALATADAVLGPAADGGWWTLGLREPLHGAVLRHVPTSTDQTGPLTLKALRGLGLRVAILPSLRDVDTAADATEVAALCRPESRFATAVGGAW